LNTCRGKPVPEQFEIKIVIVDSRGIIFRILFKEIAVIFLIENSKDDNWENCIEHIIKLINKRLV